MENREIYEIREEKVTESMAYAFGLRRRADFWAVRYGDVCKMRLGVRFGANQDMLVVEQDTDFDDCDWEMEALGTLSVLFTTAARRLGLLSDDRSYGCTFAGNGRCFSCDDDPDVSEEEVDFFEAQDLHEVAIVHFQKLSNIADLIKAAERVAARVFGYC